MPDPRSILIIKPSSLGDVVHTLPAVARVKRKWPAAKISWLVNPEWAPLLEGNPTVDEVIEFPRRRFRGLLGWAKLPAWTRTLQQKVKPDLVLDFQGLLRSGYMARQMGGEVWGLSDSREGARFFHHRVVRVPPRREPMHAVQRSLALVAALGGTVEEPLEWPLPEGGAPETTLPEQFVVLHPYARGEGKSLSEEEVAQFCRALAPWPVVLVGGKASAPEGVPAIDLFGRTTLPQLCWVLRRARFVVSVDSGPSHMAAALNPHLLAIHTWSDPRKVGPYCPAAWVWKEGRLGRMGVFPEAVEQPRETLGAWVRGQLEGRSVALG